MTCGRRGGIESVRPSVHYGPVSPLQLVLREGGDGREQLDAVENPQLQGPDDLERSDASVHVPKLGTEAFVRLAAELAAHGFRAESFDLRDYLMNPLDEESADEIQEAIKYFLDSNSVVDALRYLNNEAEDVYIVAVVVSGPTKRRFRLSQRGAITGYNSSPDPFISALRETWRKAGVS